MDDEEVRGEQMSEESIVANGIDPENGNYLMAGLTVNEVSRIAQGEKFDEAHLNELKLRAQGDEPHFGIEEGRDPKDLRQSGWGIVFAHDDREQVDAIKEALSELLDHRKEQVGDLYKEYSGGTAYRPGESKIDYLGRLGAAPGRVDPEKVPYYLLIVGSPESIPYRVQYQIDVQYGVGRLHFDTLDEYANYARSVVRAEKGEVRRSKSATFFGVENPRDRATRLSSHELIQPLAEWAASDQPDWAVNSLVKDDATKGNLASIINDGSGPALLFTASHGVGRRLGHERQLLDNGALLCQDWPGPGSGPVQQEWIYGGDDVNDSAQPAGMITFHFACYGAGTPKMDDFHRQAAKARSEIARHAFVAHLPRRLLGHPKGGALAAAGHVERAWGYSFHWSGVGKHLSDFKSTLKQLMEGHPIGSATEHFNNRYAEIASDLKDEVEEIVEWEQPADDRKLAGLWTATNDARNYAVIGDPAVRLAVKT